jgi:hypothetical protein
MGDMRAKSKGIRKHRGSTVTSFFEKEGIRLEVERLATKRATLLRVRTKTKYGRARSSSRH